MSKISSILKGWANSITKPDELEPEAKRRLEICDSCPSRRRKMCGDCGCFLPAKVRSDDSCPQDKW